MNLYNCVMLGVSNPILYQMYNFIMKEYPTYINSDYIKSECKSWKNLYESDPHITFIYGLNPPVGKHVLTNYIKIKYRDAYNSIRKLNRLNLPDPVIDSFNNEDCKVLKINFDNCDQYDLLKEVHNNLKKLPNDWKYEDYHPHLTLTYLHPDAPKSIEDNLIDKFSKLLTSYSIGDYILSGEDEVKQERFL